MIKEVSGDILLTSAQAIAHGVAPNDHFDSGLALSLREGYPSMVKDFRHYCKLHNPEPGGAWIWGSAEGVKIINLLTQEPAKGNGHPGEATLQNVGHALKALAKLVEKEKLTSLAIPKLATGVGKLKWEDVMPLLEKHLGDLHIPIYVYSTYVKGQKGEG